MLLTVGTTVAGGLPIFLVSALFVQIAHDTGAPISALGALVAVYWIAAVLASPLAGPLAQVVGSSKLAMIAISSTVVSVLGSALWAPHWYWLFAWMVFGGVSNALGHPASNHLISLKVSAKRLAMAYGLKQSAVPLAMLLSGLAIPLIALSLGWRAALGAATVLLIVFLIVFAALNPVREKVSRRQRQLTVPMGRPLRNRLLLIACISALGAGATTTAVSFMVVSAVHRGIEPGFAGIMLSTGSLMGVIARIAVGALADRGIGGTLRTVAFMQLVGAAGLVAMVATPDWVFLLGFLVSAGFGWGWAGLMHYVVSQLAGPATPAATAVQGMGTYVGNAAGPLLFGIVYDIAGEGPLWIGTGILLALAGVMALLTPRGRVAVTAGPRPAAGPAIASGAEPSTERGRAIPS